MLEMNMTSNILSAPTYHEVVEISYSNSIYCTPSSHLQSFAEHSYLKSQAPSEGTSGIIICCNCYDSRAAGLMPERCSTCAHPTCSSCETK